MTCDVCLLSHPYHRGGVTRWMADAFSSWNSEDVNAALITVKPIRKFISSGDRPLLLDLLNEKFNNLVYTSDVSFRFELGSIAFRASIYRKTILEHVPPGTPIIPSDDEACWLAASSVAKRNPFYPVIHSHGDNEYYRLLKVYQNSISGIIAVSKKVRERICQEIHLFPLDRILVNPCGLFVQDFKTHSYQRSDTVVWIGRMEEKSKRVSDIPKILEILRHSPRHINFLIIGDGEKFAYLKKFIDGFKVENLSVELLGWLNNVQIKEILRTSKVLIQTSNYEGMSLTVMEALSSGCSAVSSRVSGVEDFEQVKESENILFLYEIGDVINAAGFITNALNSHNLRTAKESEKFAAKYFDIAYRNVLLMQFFDRLSKKNAEMSEISIPYYKILMSTFLASLRLLKFKMLRILRQP
ncbi:hypothetical protein MASR2M41_05490 [Flammeovirgaceae bacterium]